MGFAPVNAGNWPTGSATTSPLTLTYSGGGGVQAVGHLLIFQFGGTNATLATTSITGITDSSGDTWPAAIEAVNLGTSSPDSEIWAILAGHTGTHTLTITLGGNPGTATYSLSEFSGALNPLTVDVKNSGTINTSSTNSPSPAITTTVAGDLVVSQASGSGVDVIKPGSSAWTGYTASNASLALGAYYLQPTAGLINSSSNPNDLFSSLSSQNWTQVIAAFEAAPPSYVPPIPASNVPLMRAANYHHEERPSGLVECRSRFERARRIFIL